MIVQKRWEKTHIMKIMLQTNILDSLLKVFLCHFKKDSWMFHKSTCFQL